MWKPYFPTFTMCGNLIPLIYSGWKPYSPTFTSSTQICKVWKLNPPHLQGVETLYHHFYQVWKPYFPTFTRCGNLIPPHLLSVETSFPIAILKVCLISQDDISIYAQYEPLCHCPVYDCSIIHTWTPKLDLIHHQPWPLYN